MSVITLEKTLRYDISCHMEHESVKQRIIAVIGGKSESDENMKEAEAVGRQIARAGAVLLCGGLSGIMEAAAKGASEEGGLSIGILPQDTTEYANKYINVPVATGMGIGRNVIIARTADALIAVGGQYGTLSEIAAALQLGKPVIGIRTWVIDGVINVQNAEEAVKKALGSSD